jgi:predicted acyl esterase
MLGVSYPGWTTAIAGLDPHPALKAISPQAPMGDAWMGDDFFHQGAFRLSYGLEYAWLLEASTDQSVNPNIGRFDSYDFYRSFSTLGDLAKAVGANAWPTWRRYVEHPAYDSIWQARSAPRYLTQAKIPTLTVGGWWDQEDEWGPLATYADTELRATGARPRRVLQTGLESLTASERRIADLAGTGLTNREIAQMLFITARTVEGHLTNVFRKLRLDSRTDLGAALTGRTVARI